MKIRLVGDTLIHAGQTDGWPSRNEKALYVIYGQEPKNGKGFSKLYVKNSQWKIFIYMGPCIVNLI